MPDDWRGLTEAQKKDLKDLFPGEAVWSGNEGNPEKFCGGKKPSDDYPDCCPKVSEKFGDPPQALIDKLGTRYVVTIRTGDVLDAGTDADALITIHGTRKVDMENLLGSFERNDTDVFHLGRDDVGDIQRIDIEHSNRGAGAGWYLKEVRIYDQARQTTTVFPANRWLATDEGDGQTKVTLSPLS